MIPQIQQAPPVFSAAARASFSAHKNGTDQTGVADATFTKVTFGTEIFDTGGYFSSSTWTPPSGTAKLTASLFVSGTGATAILLAIYKNGAFFKGSFIPALMSEVSVVDSCNGTDYYDVYGYVDVSSGTATFEGDTTYTYFCGSML